MNRRIFSHLYLLLAAVASFAAPSAAQMIDTEPYTVTVTADQADLRCGWGSDGWYSVGIAPQGTTLTADGREDQWLRVRYPDGLGFGVLVRIADVDLNEARTTVTTNRPTRPIHRNIQSPVDGSWMKLTGDPLPPGTQLRIIEVLSDRGSESHVLVEAPSTVRAYVLATDVQANENTPDTPASETTDTAPDQTNQPPATNTTEPEAAADEATQPDTTDPTQTGSDNPEQTEDVVRTAATPDQLFASYQAIVREPIEDAELEPLIEEFRRAISDAGAESPQATRLLSALNLLEIRLDLQRDLRAVASATERASREREAINNLVVDWRSRPTYTLVGRLMASALYDGRRLPLMYRLQSLDGPGGRTIAYIMPNDDLDLNAKVGAVVGVLGDTRRDRTIRVRLIDPERIDVLEPGN